MRLLTFLAKRFVAGDTMEEAAGAVKQLDEQGMCSTLDVLGENVSDREGAVKAKDSYLKLLDFIASQKLNSNVSLKLTQMGLDIDLDFCTDNLRQIVSRAKEHGNFVRVDMEGSDYTNKTLEAFGRVYKDFKENVGIVMQAYLFRSAKDIELLNQTRTSVRLCKGAYKEPASIAIKDMPSIRQNFMELSKKLLGAGGYPAFATHDPWLISELKKYTDEHKKDKGKFEFQMLYGIRRKLSKKLATEGYKVRIYVPFGTHWLPYTMRRLRERKENVLFVLKSFFTD